MHNVRFIARATGVRTGGTTMLRQVRGNDGGAIAQRWHSNSTAMVGQVRRSSGGAPVRLAVMGFGRHPVALVLILGLWV